MTFERLFEVSVLQCFGLVMIEWFERLLEFNSSTFTSVNSQLLCFLQVGSFNHRNYVHSNLIQFLCLFHALALKIPISRESVKISVSLIQQIHEHRNLGSLRFVKKVSFHKQITSRLGLALCLTIFSLLFSHSINI